jgi:transketolase
MRSKVNVTPQAVRKIILEASKRANVGHIGSALSISDLISILYDKVLNIPSHNAEDRDRFILSKGHAALALYAAFYLKGWITKEQLDTYCGDNSQLGVHPEHHLPGVEFSTGSLGQGLSLGAGVALAARLKNRAFRSFVLLSDAEINEGSVWEAIAFAGHHKLSNLIAIVDINSQQALGYTKDVLDFNPYKDKWQSFGWDVFEVDGHDLNLLEETFKKIQTENKKAPHVVLARTTFGKNVSYMENKIKWHYWPMSEEEYKVALKEVESAL